MRGGRKGSLWLLLCAVVLWQGTCWALPSSYHMKVSVETQGSSVSEAKEKAVFVAKEQAFLALLSRLGVSKDVLTFPEFSKENFFEYVGSFSIREERFSENLYNATFSVEFDAVKFRDVLHKHRVTFLERDPVRLVLLPVLVKEGKLILWNEEENIWHRSWRSLKDIERNIQLLCPLGDLEDQSSIVLNELSELKKSVLLALKNRYKSDDVLVTVLSLDREEAEKEEEAPKYRGFIRFLPYALQNSKKMQTIGPFFIPLDSEAPLEEYRDTILSILEDQKEADGKSVHDAHGVLKVKLISEKPLHLKQSLQKIQSLSTVQSVRIHSISKQETFLWVHFRGKLSDLQEKLAYEGFVVDGDLDLTILR